MIYGWRGKIGIIVPAHGTVPETDFHGRVPEGVAILTTRIPFEKVTVEGLIKMATYLEEAATLLARGKPNLIVFICTTGSLVKGIGYDTELVQRIQQHTGIPATTTTTALIEALKTLGAKRVAIATPYSEEVNQVEKSFLEDSGFEVASIKGLGFTDPTKMPEVHPENMYKLAKEVFAEDVDVMFISCTGISVLDIIESLEQDLKRPVVTSIQVTLWASLKKIKVGKRIDGLGKLFTL